MSSADFIEEQDYKILGWCNAAYIGMRGDFYRFRRTDGYGIHSFTEQELVHVKQWRDNEDKRAVRVAVLGESANSEPPGFY